MKQYFTIMLIINDPLERLVVRNFLNKDIFDLIEINFDNRMQIRLDLIKPCDIAIFDIDYLYQIRDRLSDQPDAAKLAVFIPFMQSFLKFFPDCVTIGLTSQNSRDGLRAVRNCGIQQLFLKPYDPIKFICKIYQTCLESVNDIINTINNNHRDLVTETKELAAKIEENSINKDLLYQRIRLIIDHLEEHYLREEQAMEHRGYPQKDHHHQIHLNMVIAVKDAFSYYQDGRIHNIIKPILRQIKEDITQDKAFILFLRDQHNQLIRRNAFDSHPCDELLQSTPKADEPEPIDAESSDSS